MLSSVCYLFTIKSYDVSILAFYLYIGLGHKFEAFVSGLAALRLLARCFPDLKKLKSNLWTVEGGV